MNFVLLDWLINSKRRNESQKKGNNELTWNSQFIKKSKTIKYQINELKNMKLIKEINYKDTD